MSWKDRIKEGAITTPDGERYVFEWEDVERTFEKKTSEYQFSDTDGTLVQDFGVGKIDYPMTIYFSGEDHDTNADKFFNSAIQRGVSIFESPRYGVVNVVIKSSPQRDSIRSAANQTVFNLEMTETIIVEVPDSMELVRSSILAAQEEFISTNAEAFDSELNVDNVGDKLRSKNRFLQFVKDFKDTFKNIVSTVGEINDAFNEISDYINDNIDFLMGQPLLLATSIQRLMSAPARVKQSVKSRIDGYMQGYNKLLNDPDGERKIDLKNQRVEKQLLATAHLSGMAEVYLFADTDGIGFLTKLDAVNAALNLKDQYSAGQEFLDQQENDSASDNLSQRFEVDDSVTQGIKNITALTSRDLLRLSFSLKQERIFITDKWYNLFDLCYKLYKTTQDDYLDFLIDSNKLEGNEIVKIPKNKSIKYYV